MSSSDKKETLESYGSEMGRESGTSPIEWVLVNGNRFYVTGLILLVVSIWFLGLYELGIIAFQNADSITRLAGGMVAGTFSLVTLVVSINQMILSREFTSAGEARNKLEGVMEFRKDIEETTDIPATPASPVALFYLLCELIRDRSQQLGNTINDEQGQESHTLIKSYVSGIDDSVDNVADTFEESSFGTFDVVSAAANYNDAWQIYAGRQLKNNYSEDVSQETIESFDKLLDALELFNIARTHFKTTYMQRELTRFSRLTLYCGVPAIFAAMTLGFLYGETGGSAINPMLLPYFVTALLVIVASPLALMTAYILRTATLVRRTTSIGPMIPQKDPEDDPFEISYGE